MKGSERESRGADRPAPHAHTFTPTAAHESRRIRTSGGQRGRGVLVPPPCHSPVLPSTVGANGVALAK